MSNNSESWQWIDEDPIEKLLRRTASEKDVNADELVNSGRSCFAQCQFDKAAALYKQAVEAGHAAAHFDLGVCLERMQQWKPAADSFRRALELDPNQWQALVGLGSCLMHMEELEKALECFDRCVEGSAPPETALMGKGVALQKLGRYQEAEKMYREILEITPDSPEALTNLIALSIARENPAAVAQYSSHLLKFLPRSKAALQGMATLAIKNGDQEAAINYCTRLVEVDPDSFEGRFNLRYAHQRMRKAGKNARSIA